MLFLLNDNEIKEIKSQITTNFSPEKKKRNEN